MATEFNDNWEAIGVSKGNGVLSKSHRPINPFYNITGGWNEYKLKENRDGFKYHDVDKTILTQEERDNNPDGLIDGSKGGEINAVGRHHPGGDKLYGGHANFLYADGHVEDKTVRETYENQEWGDKYYAISGRNKVINYDR